MISFDISQVEKLKNIGKTELTTDLKFKLLSGIADLIRQDIEKRYNSSPPTVSGGYVFPGDIEWKKLAQSYLDSHPNRITGQILIDTGASRDSLIRENANGNITNIDPENGTLEVGSSIEYLAKQHSKRPVYVYHEQLKLEITNYITKFLQDNLYV